MLCDIRLQNYRSYIDASFEFGEGVNIIVGPNGSGKTNLLEAIQVVLVGGSYRVNDAELIAFGAPWMRLDARTDVDSTRTVKIVTEPKQQKSFEFDEKKYLRLTHDHTLPVVLFEPNHLQLLHGAPEFRRQYLDDILEQTKPGYASFRRNYRRVLAQRNALLKRGRTSREELFPWDLRLSELGAVISRSRGELIAEIAPKLYELYKTLSHSDTEVSISYKSQFLPESYESTLLHTLETAIDRDVARGFTAYGPHREDVAVSMNGHAATDAASRGETRTVILGLKIIELEFIEKARGITPVLLLDDVFSELDGARRRALTSYLQSHQTFLTTTDADVVIKHFTDSTILPLG